MNFDFDYFREVIDAELTDYVGELDKTCDKYFERIVFINNEAADFDILIREAKIDLGTEQQQHFVRRHQLLLIDFANELLSIMGEEGLTADDKDGEEIRLNICRHLFDTVVDCLTELERNFPHMFLLDVPIPDAYRVEALRQLRALLPQLRAQLAEKGIDKKLLEIATEPLDEFLHAGNDMFYTYSIMSYLNRLARELQKAALTKEEPEGPKQEPAKDPGEAIFERLRILNLNSSAFQDHIIGGFRADLKARADYREKQLWLIRELKDWEQL